jgi:hypothetical protein
VINPRNVHGIENIVLKLINSEEKMESLEPNEGKNGVNLLVKGGENLAEI